MDLSKAFDCVNHDKLLNKLYAYGGRGLTQDLIRSYLTNREQKTKITRICPTTKNELVYYSDFKKVECGVPQGSVLGPLLFIIYINDLPRVTKHKTVLFADDSTIILSGRNNHDLIRNLNDALNDIITWLTSNNLKINLSKTHIMTFNIKNNSNLDLNIYYAQQKIEKVNTTKFLGINIDQNLNWKTHVDTLCSKLAQFSYALYMLSRVADIPALLTAYHGYVASTLQYGIIFWGNSTGKEFAFKAQKKCLRSMFNLKRTVSCKPYFIKWNILSLPCLYIYNVILFVRSNIDKFKNHLSKRHNYKLCIPTNRTAILNNSVFCMAPRLYNNLHRSIIEIEDDNLFKKTVKLFLLQKCYYSVVEYLNDKPL